MADTLLAMRILIASFALAGLGAYGSAANIVLNGDFESDAYADGTAPAISSLTGWDILSTGNIHGVGNGYLGSVSQQVDVSGYADVAGSGISQDLTTIASTQYDLSFDFFVDGYSGSMEVFIGATSLGTVAASGSYSYSFTGTGTDTLKFVNLGTGVVAHVDNVNVEAVPEPGTIAALGLGLAALKRRRK